MVNDKSFCIYEMKEMDLKISLIILVGRRGAREEGNCHDHNSEDRIGEK